MKYYQYKVRLSENTGIVCGGRNMLHVEEDEIVSERKKKKLRRSVARIPPAYAYICPWDINTRTLYHSYHMRCLCTVSAEGDGPAGPEQHIFDGLTNDYF